MLYWYVRNPNANSLNPEPETLRLNHDPLATNDSNGLSGCGGDGIRFKDHCCGVLATENKFPKHVRLYFARASFAYQAKFPLPFSPTQGCCGVVTTPMRWSCTLKSNYKGVV